MLSGGFRFALPTLRSYEAKEKGSGSRQTCSANLRISRCGAHPFLFPLPRLRGRVGRGRARLSASHYGSYRQGFRPLGATPGQASWDAAGRSIRYARSNRGAKILRSYTGVTRARLSQSRERTSRTGRSAGQHDARSCPGTECIVPRAGTALAPPSGVPSAEGVLHRARFDCGYCCRDSKVKRFRFVPMDQAILRRASFLKRRRTRLILWRYLFVMAGLDPASIRHRRALGA